MKRSLKYALVLILQLSFYCIWAVTSSSKLAIELLNKNDISVISDSLASIDLVKRIVYQKDTNVFTSLKSTDIEYNCYQGSFTKKNSIQYMVTIYFLEPYVGYLGDGRNISIIFDENKKFLSFTKRNNLVLMDLENPHIIKVEDVDHDGISEIFSQRDHEGGQHTEQSLIVYWGNFGKEIFNSLTDISYAYTNKDGLFAYKAGYQIDKNHIYLNERFQYYKTTEPHTKTHLVTATDDFIISNGKVTHVKGDYPSINEYLGGLKADGFVDIDWEF
ncbi:MAG TPA: hypothetical protein PLE74_02100 [Candidatus Cloacimonadota bacterium]|nr:hypothetical protein [Candidatus Cloacimonadota bacterium]